MSSRFITPLAGAPPDNLPQRFYDRLSRMVDTRTRAARQIVPATKSIGCDNLPRLFPLNGAQCDPPPEGQIILAASLNGALSDLGPVSNPMLTGAAGSPGSVETINVPIAKLGKPRLVRYFVDTFGNLFKVGDDGKTAVCIGTGDTRFPHWPHGGQNPFSGSFSYGRENTGDPVDPLFHRYFVTEHAGPGNVPPAKTWEIPARWDANQDAYAGVGPYSAIRGVSAIEGLAHLNEDDPTKTVNVIYAAECHAIGSRALYGHVSSDAIHRYPVHAGVGLSVRCDQDAPGLVGSGTALDLPLIARDPSSNEVTQVDLGIYDYPQGYPADGNQLTVPDPVNNPLDFFFPPSSVGPFFPQPTITTDERGWAWLILIPREVSSSGQRPRITTAALPMTVRGFRFSLSGLYGFKLGPQVTLTDPDSIATGYPDVVVNGFSSVMVAAVYGPPV